MAGPAGELKIARTLLGWDPLTLGQALRLAGSPEKVAARVQDMEAGKREISGPVQVRGGPAERLAADRLGRAGPKMSDPAAGMTVRR